MKDSDIGKLIRLKQYPWIPKYQYQVGIVLDIKYRVSGNNLYTIYLFKPKEKVVSSIYEFDFIRV